MKFRKQQQIYDSSDTGIIKNKEYAYFVDVTGMTTDEEKAMYEKAAWLAEFIGVDIYETRSKLWIDNLIRLIVEGRKSKSDAEILNYILHELQTYEDEREE